MEHIKTDDTVYFSANFYHPVSGQSINADTTPRYLVYEDGTAGAILNGTLSVRSDFLGSYYGSFTASAANGFDSNSFYDVQVSGVVNDRHAMASVKQFVLDDIFDANIVQISGDNVELGTTTDLSTSSQVMAVSGDINNLNDPSANTIATEVWNTTLSDHRDAGSTGMALVTASGNLISGDWSTHSDVDVRTEMDNNSDIIADTNEIQQNFATYNDVLSASGAIEDKIDTLNDPSADVIANTVWNEQLGGHITVDSAGHALGIVNSGIIDSNITQVSGENVSINDFHTDVSNLDQDIYFANVKYIRDNVNDQDEYGVQWFKNDQPVSSGNLTEPAISVYNTNDGTALIEHQLMTYASPNLGVVRYNESSSVITSGEPYLIETSGTIDSITRTWKYIIGIDKL